MSIVLVAPANTYTDGPTAIFQLCHYLGEWFGLPAVIAFTGVKGCSNPVHLNYRKYRCKWITFHKVRDTTENLIIVPETKTDLLSRFKRAKKAIYWLSVDNFFLSRRYSSKISSASGMDAVLAGC